jgi:hypothetical protein
MHLKPDLQVSAAVAQAMVDRVASDRHVATVYKLHGGEIAAVYEIAFVDPAHRPVVLKVYPEELHWKMKKEVTVISLTEGRLSVPVPRILSADDSKTLLSQNFTLMTKLNGSILGEIEPSLTSDTSDRWAFCWHIQQTAPISRISSNESSKNLPSAGRRWAGPEGCRVFRRTRSTVGCLPASGPLSQ